LSSKAGGEKKGVLLTREKGSRQEKKTGPRGDLLNWRVQIVQLFFLLHPETISAGRGRINAVLREAKRKKRGIG